jgi:hypothetical protein
MDPHQYLVVRRTGFRKIDILETRRRGEEKGFHDGE